MNSQSLESSNWDNFRTPPWESRKKCHLDIGVTGKHREYYMGEGGGFPQVWAVVSHVNPRSPVACSSIQSALKGELTNLLVGLMQVQVTK